MHRRYAATPDRSQGYTAVQMYIGNCPRLAICLSQVDEEKEFIPYGFYATPLGTLSLQWGVFQSIGL